MNSTSFSEIRDEFQNTCDWLAALGVRIENNRIQKYQKTLDEILDAWKRQETVISQTQEDGFVNTLYEIGELTQLHRSFSESVPESFSEKVKIICKGNNSFVDDSANTNTTSRNIAFELLVASRLHLAGLQIRLDLTDDVAYNINYGYASVQCKRCKSRSNVRANCEEASRQINVDVNSTKNDVKYGVVALDFTKIINPENIVYKANNQDALENQIKYGIDLAIRNHLDNGQRLSSNTIGVLIRFSSIGQILKTGDPAYIQYYTFWPMYEDSRTSHLIESLKLGHMGT